MSHKTDHIIEYSKPAKKPDWIGCAQFDALPDKIAVREFKQKGKIYVTTLTDAKVYTKRSIFKLYCHRWEIETNICQIKTILGMNILSCKTPKMISKEIPDYP
ncbi:MAG: transposase [Pseudomonadales bacterium]|nr:transposase [Pseudomonadales bacterium]